MPVLHRSLFILGCLILPLKAALAEDWSLCSFPVITPDPQLDNSNYVSEITANQLNSQNRDYLLFDGQVEFRRNTQSINADTLKLYREPQRLQASGNIEYTDDLLKLNTEQLSFNNDQQQGMFQQSEFQLFQNHMRGSALSIEQSDNLHSQFQDVSFTTCDPGDNHWSLSASKLSLNKETHQGTAQNALLKIGKVPVFYFPWMMFPIGDQRMSGILSPTISSSDNDGDTLTLPVYWNLAPNYDMTITPVWYSKRSLQINTENRYLFDQNQGQLQLSWLDDDTTHTERWYRQWLHEMDTSSGIHSSIQYQRVSDEQFLEDFDHLQSVSYVDFLRSAVSLSGNIANWDARLLFEEYQTIDLSQSLAARPYRRLPRLTVNRITTTEPFSVNLDWKNEWVRFDRDDSITGERLHLAPEISYPMQGDYYFIKPSLQLDYTEYRLDNNRNDVNAIQRSIPMLSVDSGLFFERSAGADGEWIQTLEPRLYLLYVPYEEQSDIPDFDTSLVSENYNSLFLNNRFYGADRVGDSQQLSFGLSTRFLDKAQGNEWFSASIAQAFYASEREVSLGSSIDERSKSSLMSKLSYRPTTEWSIQLASAYDQQQKESQQTDIALRRRAGEQIFNLEYHFRKDSLEQSTFSMVYPVSSRWTSYLKRQYSIRKERPVQNLLGLAYDSCCWKFDLLYEEYADEALTKTDRGVYFQFTFKGLSSAGKDIGTILEDGILGYSTQN